MSSIDVEGLLSEISPDSPCGEDLEYDADFTELEISAQGTEEQQFGDTVVASEEPDWQAVKSNAVGLLGRTKDLRVMRFLTMALVRTGGVAGLRDCLQLWKGLLDRYWTDLHPQLDPDDDNDPTERVNVVRSLADSATILFPLRKAPLVASRGLGQFNLRDIELATGRASLPDGSEESAPELATIDGAFMDCDLDELSATAAALDEAVTLVSQVESTISDQVGGALAPELNDLSDVLREAQREVGTRLAQRAPVASPEAAVDASGEGAAGPADVGGAAPGGAGVPGEIRSREDVVRALDKVCTYYERHEPSSPVPILVKRARKLVTMDFLDIVRDLTPDGLSQAEMYRGSEDEEV